MKIKGSPIKSPSHSRISNDPHTLKLDVYTMLLTNPKKLIYSKPLERNIASSRTSERNNMDRDTYSPPVKPVKKRGRPPGATNFSPRKRDKSAGAVQTVIYPTPEAVSALAGFFLSFLLI